MPGWSRPEPPRHRRPGQARLAATGRDRRHAGACVGGRPARDRLLYSPRDSRGRVRMKRRELLRGAGLAAVATGLAACAPRPQGGTGPAASAEVLHWKMVTSWPTNFPGLGTGAARLAEMITAASGGRLNVKVYGAGELVPAFEVFDAVSRGTAEMGHAASYYWKGKAAAAPFFCAVPFGLNAQEMNGWLYEGGGLALWRELYAPFGLVPFPAGNTGVQMAGWFRQ